MPLSGNPGVLYFEITEAPLKDMRTGLKKEFGSTYRNRP